MTFRTAAHADLGLDLDLVAGQGSISTEANRLAELAIAGSDMNHPDALLGLSIDVASTREADGEISLLFVRVRPAAHPGPLVNRLLEVAPLIGAELVHAWSLGRESVLLSQDGDLDGSLAARRARGQVSNHEWLGIQKKAIDWLEISAPQGRDQ